MVACSPFAIVARWVGVGLVGWVGVWQGGWGVWQNGWGVWQSGWGVWVGGGGYIPKCG